MTEYCVMAWTDGGFAEMRAAVFATREEAERDAAQRRETYPRWRFRVATMEDA